MSTVALEATPRQYTLSLSSTELWLKSKIEFYEYGKALLGVKGKERKVKTFLTPIMLNYYSLLLRTSCKTEWAVVPSAAWKRKQLHNVEQRQDMISPMWLINLLLHCSLAHSLFQSENNDNHNKAPLLIQLHYSLVEFTIADKNP